MAPSLAVEQVTPAHATLPAAVTATVPSVTSSNNKLVLQNPVVKTLNDELQRSMALLKGAGQAPLYYLAYRLYEGEWETISASNGAILDDNPYHPWRMLSVDLRVGSPRFDNTHFLRGANTSAPHFYDSSVRFDSILPSAGSQLPLAQCLWMHTDSAFKEAQRRYADLRASNDTLAAEEDNSSDFSLQPARQFNGQIQNTKINRHEWEERVRRLSRLFLSHPGIERANVSFTSQPVVRYFVNSEGTRLIEQQLNYSVTMHASTVTTDGQTVWLYDSAESRSADGLPSEAVLAKKIEKLAHSLEELRNAPVAEPYVGPAILSGRAAAVFFHETFGHRVEAIHEKNENEGKTFAKKMGTQVMPKFMSVIDDPTVSTLAGQQLNGHYIFDDQGVPAQQVKLVTKGVLTGLLTDRTLVQGIKASNGHGRSAPGWNPIARQANLIVSSDEQVSPQALKKLLIEEAIKQHKPYGLYFEEISGGSTFTAAASDQSYSIYPLKVYKVFVDNRPDQLVRGAEITGTPLAALERIMAAGNDHEIFNGRCGRDSGMIPVSAIAPSLLIRSVEIKRAAKPYYRPPVLPDPSVVTEKVETTKPKVK
jgi:TldD protein